MTQLVARVKPLSQTGDLAAQWRALEDRLARPFFLSWDWAATAIAYAPENLLVAEIKNEAGALEGLGLFSAVNEKRHGLFRIRQLRLNEAGVTADAMAPAEYNNFLIAPALEKAAWKAILAALKAGDAPLWDEIIVTNALTPIEEEMRAREKHVHRRAENISAYVDLKALRRDGANGLDGYLASLSRNTRSQIRRALRLYEAQGPITLRRAQNVQQAQQFLHALGELHEAKWRARGGKGLLSNRHFLDFHLKLIERCFDDGKVELIRIAAGDEPFGWLHNFVDREQVLFNLGGFKTETDNRYKPGLAAQALAIADHMDRGAEIYDFLAGGDRYKLNLGVKGPDMVSFAIQKPTPALMVENAGRWFKQKTENFRRPKAGA